MSEADQGTVAAATAGLASLAMNTDDKNVSAPKTAAATTNGSSQVLPQKPPPSKATMSTTTTGDVNVSEAGGVNNTATDAEIAEPSVSAELGDSAKKQAAASKSKDAAKKNANDNTTKIQCFE